MEIKHKGLGVYELKRSESVIDSDPDIITVIPYDDGVKVKVSNELGVKGEVFLYREELNAINEILRRN